MCPGKICTRWAAFTLRLPRRSSEPAKDGCARNFHDGALRHCRIPVLFIHGAEDHFVPLEMTLENYRVCAAPKRLLIVPGAGHAMSCYQDPAQYQRGIREFWDAYERREEIFPCGP